MSISSKQKLIIIACVVVLLTMVVGAGFISFTQHIKNLAQNTIAAEKKLAAFEYERQNVRAIEKLIEEKKTDITRIRAHLVSRERPIVFLDEMTALGRKTGNKIALDYAEQESDTASIAFRISLEGMRHNVLTYLKLLELTPFAITVENIIWQNVASPQVAAPALEKQTDTRVILTIRVKTE